MEISYLLGKEQDLGFSKEGSPLQYFPSSGSLSVLQQGLYFQTQNQTGNYSLGYRPLVVTVEATYYVNEHNTQLDIDITKDKCESTLVRKFSDFDVKSD